MCIWEISYNIHTIILSYTTLYLFTKCSVLLPHNPPNHAKPIICVQNKLHQERPQNDIRSIGPTMTSYNINERRRHWCSLHPSHYTYGGKSPHNLVDLYPHLDILLVYPHLGGNTTFTWKSRSHLWSTNQRNGCTQTSFLTTTQSSSQWIPKMGSFWLKSLHIWYWCFLVGRHVSKHLDSSVFGKTYSWSCKNQHSEKMSQAKLLFLLQAYILDQAIHLINQADHDRYDIPTVRKSRLHQKIPRKIRLAVARSNKLETFKFKWNQILYTYHIRPALRQEKAGQLSCR